MTKGMEKKLDYARDDDEAQKILMEFMNDLRGEDLVDEYLARLEPLANTEKVSRTRERIRKSKRAKKKISGYGSDDDGALSGRTKAKKFKKRTRKKITRKKPKAVKKLKRRKLRPMRSKKR
jgi:hypothetical protein